MRLAIMQPYFFPYIGYWQLINAVDQYVIYDDVNFIKGGWINRNKILMNGESRLFTLHLNSASPNKLINEVQVKKDSILNKKLLRTITENYQQAPYFQNVFSIIEETLTQDEINLSKYLELHMQRICKYLNIHTELMSSSTLKKDNSLRGQEKIISICNLLNADTYINAIGGKELYSQKDFLEQNIRLFFLRTRDIKYKQFKNTFVPHLSIIDVMMFISVEDIAQLLEEYDLV